METCLLNVKEFSDYMHIGNTQARNLLRNPTCPFSLKIGNRWYAHKELLDKWLLDKTNSKLWI